MRGTDLPRLVAVLRDPIETFVRDSRVRVSLLITGSGQILAQHGFTSSYEVMNVASLAAAAHAASRALAQLLHVGRWLHLHHAGTNQEIFLATLETPVEKLIFVTIFDTESSLGLVQYFFGQLSDRVGAMPELSYAERSADQKTFEADLEAGLDRVLTQQPRNEV